MTRLQGPAHADISHLWTPAHDGRADPSFEGRWAQWQAKGQVHEARVHRRLFALAVVVGVGAAALVTWAVALA